ncbi:nitrate- and nitrite sensing domain-containing protein [Streptomyces oryzae]|uniref:histidine kinase n=1 Tax=Streptomyces oryzae TaxID=1434886 RepID=A0ABS3XID2_9ACTN|nr:nitrate- and nitrite sensing domain-containing protein [Streptomyces oryzae]MBO8194856.1 nitrate- and nitrite sensing domain-containing protein [Streptomyces oryzae]
MGRRRARVRNRLLVSVVVCAAAVVGAGAPTLVAGSQDAADAQELVDLARLNQQAIAFSHSLADERDGMVEYVAAGRSGKGGTGVSEAQRDRVDRQAQELRAAASSAPSGSEAAAPSASPEAVVKAVKKLPAARQGAMRGRGSPLASYEAYSEIIQALRHLTRGIADGLPARAENRTAAALPDLARAVDQASATRGLLEAALAGQGSQRPLVTAAGQARLREQAALSDFEETADAKARDSYSTTVNGTDVNVAERYLTTVTAQNHLTAGARALDRERFDSSVSARLAHMRGVQSSFAVAEVKRLEKLRDDDVTALQLRAGLVGGCLLLAVALSIATARSLTRPLSVLKRGSQRLAKDPVGEEPITFRGRNDEFAEVVRALNSLRAGAAELRRRSACAEREQDQLAVEKAQLTEKHQLLTEEFAALRTELEAGQAAREQSAAPTAGGEAADHSAFADLGSRTLTLVERQLGIIEGLEEREADPDRLDTLFKLDHLATRMRRHSENLLLLAGAERPERGAPSAPAAPAPLLDVLRAAVSEIAQYERVELGTLPPEVRVDGSAADDLSHLVAELLDNAAAFSPAETAVRLSARMLASGEALVSVEDEGEGVPGPRLAALNTRLDASQVAEDDGSGPWGLGMSVVARLSARHRIRVRLRGREGGGTAAEVTVPHALVLDGVDRTQTSGAAAGSEPSLNAGEPPQHEDESPQDESGPAPAEDEHSRTDDQAPTQAEEPEGSEAADRSATQTHAELGERGEQAEPPASVTHPGLPQRVRRETPREPTAPHQRKGGTTAEELRRKLDGFQQGAREGLRDAMAHTAAGSPTETEQGRQSRHNQQGRHSQDNQQPGQESRAEQQTESTDDAEERAGAQVDGGTATGGT